MTAELTPAFASERVFAPGETVRGEMVFLVPEETGDLALVHFTADGPSVLDLTPDTVQTPPPEPLAGPTEAPPLRAALYAVERADDGTDAAPRVAVDLALTLLADDPQAEVTYDPMQYVILRTGDGSTFRPVASDEGLRRPLGTPELWANQLTRGELAFHLEGLNEPPSSLMLDVYGGHAPITFELPVEEVFPPSPEPEPLAAARKAMALSPPPVAAVDQDQPPSATVKTTTPALAPPPEPGGLGEVEPERSAEEPTLAGPSDVPEPGPVAEPAHEAASENKRAEGTDTPDPAAPADLDTAEGSETESAVIPRGESESGEEKQETPGSVLLTSNAGRIDATLAHAVSGHGEPMDPTHAFPEDAENIYLIFRSEADRPRRVALRFFADEVPHRDPTKVYASGNLRIPAGARNHFELRPPPGGFEPGRYRVMLEADGETVELPFTVEPKYPFALREHEIELPRGYNIALAALGGRLESVTSEYNDRQWAGANLIDGIPFDVTDSGQSCVTCGWSSRGDELPQEIVLSFREQREAAIAAVVLDPRTGNARPDRMPKHVEIWASSEPSGGGFARIGAGRLHQEFVRQVITLPEGTRARRLKLVVTANFGGPHTKLGEIAVIEADSLQASILEGAEINLVRPALGGAVVRLTSWSGGDNLVARLTDGDPAGKAWRSYDDYLPQTFVFAFHDDLAAAVDRLILTLGPEEAVESWPRRVSIAVSEEDPLHGFEEVGVFDVSAQPGEHAFPIGREARFVRLRILENGGGRRTTLTEVALIEGSGPGYLPVLLREDEQPAGSPQAAASPGAQITADAEEVEPNDNRANANELPLAAFTRGSIDPLGEVDWFALGEEVADARAITFEIAGWPNVRTSVSLLDANGQPVRQFDPGKRPAEHTAFTWLLDGTERFVQVTEPEVSVVLVWDTSGSMQGSTEDLERAVRAYVNQVPPSQRLSLIRFSADIEVLLGDFTTDKDRLRSAIHGKFTANGGTRFYDAVGKAIELLQGVPGNRAIVVMTDGADTGSQVGHPGFWQLLEDERVRLYAIGLGSAMRDPLPSFGSTGERILGHAALATNGRLFFAEASDQLAAFYAEIAEDLHRTAVYALKPTLDRGDARFDVVATGERITRITAPQIELILDASGSMRERKKRVDGRLKIEVAKDVLREVVAAMPEHGEVALRVYGQRIREGSPGDCQDTELLYPFAPLDRARLLAEVDRIEALGTTPLTYALEQAAGDFSAIVGEKIIVLITDGKEECGGRPQDTAAALRAQGLDVRVNIVGFALADEDTKRDMRETAAITGGIYLDAADQEQLVQALEQAMAASYELHDAAGRGVTGGTVGGESVTVPEGIYTLSVQAVGESITVPGLKLVHEHWTRVELRKEGEEVGTSVRGPLSVDEVDWQVAVPAGQVANRLVLARSSSLGLEIAVEYEGDLWCSPELSLRFDAEETGVFASTAMPDLLRKLTKVLESECSSARSASIKGYVPGGEAPVYQSALSINEQ